jgi:hypothetical protein
MAAKPEAVTLRRVAQTESGPARKLMWIRMGTWCG